MDLNNIYLVGTRFHHHSQHSGYEIFHRLVGIRLKPPYEQKSFAGRLGYHKLIGDIGWRLDNLISSITPRRLYWHGIFFNELSAGFHMLRNKGALYHILYGDTDLWLLGYIKKITGAKLIATFHEPPHSLEWLKVDRIVSNLDAIFLVSESQRPYFEDIFPSEKIFVIHHAIDTEFFKPAKRPAKSSICITVGSKYRDFKTFELAIDLILKEKPGTEIIAIGVGRTDANVPMLNHAKVKYLDNISDEKLLSLYQDASVAIFPFLYSTANNALLEAMACGIPIVATDVGGTREYLDNNTAILCPLNDHSAIADGALKILNNSSLASKLSEYSRKSSLKFDYRNVCKDMMKIYQMI